MLNLITFGEFPYLELFNYQISFVIHVEAIWNCCHLLIFIFWFFKLRQLNSFILQNLTHLLPWFDKNEKCWIGFNLKNFGDLNFKNSIGLHHPLDGVTNPKYRLLHFIQLTIFCKKKRALAFNRYRCGHLVLCLWLILIHYLNDLIQKLLN